MQIVLNKVESSKVVNCWFVSQGPSASDEVPLLETLEFFEISHGSDQPFNFLLERKFDWRPLIQVESPAE